MRPAEFISIERVADSIRLHLEDDRDPVEIYVSGRLVAWVFERPDLQRLWWEVDGRRTSAKIKRTGECIRRRLVYLEMRELRELIAFRGKAVLTAKWVPVPGVILDATDNVWLYATYVGGRRDTALIPKRIVIGEPQIGSRDISVPLWFASQYGLPVIDESKAGAA